MGNSEREILAHVPNTQKGVPWRLSWKEDQVPLEVQHRCVGEIMSMLAKEICAVTIRMVARRRERERRAEARKRDIFTIPDM